jgi:putative oxidoreductase
MRSPFYWGYDEGNCTTKYNMILRPSTGLNYRNFIKQTFLLYSYLNCIAMKEYNSSALLASNNNWLAIPRIALGMILMWKSINLIRNTAQAESLIQQTGVGIFSDNAHVLAFIVSYLGLLCGFFILVGLFTRISSIIMIPVLLVAVFFINIKQVQTNLFEFILSLVALLLLILFAFKDSGFFSADEYFRRGAEMDRRAHHA